MCFFYYNLNKKILHDNLYAIYQELYIYNFETSFNFLIYFLIFENVIYIIHCFFEKSRKF